MFDDQNINNPNQTPGNLPMGEPEDMFDKTEDSMPMDQPESISAVDVGKLQPKTMAPPPLAPTPPMVSPQYGAETMGEPRMQVMPSEVDRANKIKGPTFAKNMMKMLIVLAGVGILGGGSWLVYVFFVKQPATPVEEFTSTPTQEEVVNTVETPVVEIGAPEPEPVLIPEVTVNTTSTVIVNDTTDTDADNLSDSMETALGTNLNNWDTDLDGLGDGEEVNVWKSNPLLPDTDGDTFLDGAEVKNGYNPIGPGKIFGN